MKKSRDNGFVAKADIAYDNLGNSYRMQYIWFPGTSSDALVCFICKIKSLLYHLEFCLVCTPFACSFLQVGIVSCYDFIVLSGEF